MNTDIKSSFKGKSMEFIPKGSTHVVLRGQDEHYVVNRPINSVHNLLFGTLYIDLAGKSVTINRKTREKCVMKFIKRGWGGKNAFKLKGEIFDSDDNLVYVMNGFWNKEITITHQETGDETLIWTMNERPEQWDHLYHFSLFTLQLNYIDDELMEKLPCTDSRLRPDQRALENGDLETASKEKHNVEEYQRKLRKEREKDKIEWVPRYFATEIDEETKEKTYIFNGQYWKDRESGKVKEFERVF